MKFLQKIAAALLVIGLALGASAGCAEGEKPLSAQEKVYVQARELGYDGTLEEFLRLVAHQFQAVTEKIAFAVGRGAVGDPLVVVLPRP